jgi:uncharacterized membrane protein
MKSINATPAAVAGLIALGSFALVSQTFAADKPDMEKCYGVAKAGKNDCASNGHACAGQSKADKNAAEWLSLPKGTCERLVGGSLTPPKK